MSEEIVQIYAIAALVVWSVIAGRLWCGKICPVGKLQDLTYKTPLPIKITLQTVSVRL
jgi:polyferredoxin